MRSSRTQQQTKQAKKRRPNQRRSQKLANLLRGIVVEGFGVAVLVFLFTTTQFSQEQVQKFTHFEFLNDSSNEKTSNMESLPPITARNAVQPIIANHSEPLVPIYSTH